MKKTFVCKGLRAYIQLNKYAQRLKQESQQKALLRLWNQLKLKLLIETFEGKSSQKAWYHKIFHILPTDKKQFPNKQRKILLKTMIYIQQKLPWSELIKHQQTKNQVMVRRILYMVKPRENSFLMAIIYFINNKNCKN